MPEKKEKHYDDRQRRSGTLLRIHDNGYGFIEMGRGEPPVFILRHQVAPQHWVKGQVFTFVLMDPKPGTRAPRADKVLHDDKNSPALEEELAQ